MLARLLEINTALGLLLVIALIGCGKGEGQNTPSAGGQNSAADVAGSDTDPYSIAFVTNQIASFWNIAKVGCEDAGKDFNLNVEVRMPAVANAVEQKRIVEDLLSRGIDGIAISPIDADNQADLINQWSKQVPLITHDSDAPGTERLMYIGMDNYEAGRMCGQLVREAIPDGGEVVLFIGRLEQDNSKRRRQGVIDELLGRDFDPSRFDPADEEIRGDRYTILGTLTDTGQPEMAKRKAEDAITTYPGMDAMVGLFAYNPPACLQALKSQGKLGQIALVGFDEDDETLQGIKDGYIHGTIVQNPYEYGYRSMSVLKSILDGDKSVIPASKFDNIRARTVRKENVDEFWDELKARLDG